METIIQNIKSIIKVKGLKQKAVASMIGKSDRQFSDMLNHRKKIEPQDVADIALALEVTPNDLFGVIPNNKTA